MPSKYDEYMSVENFKRAVETLRKLATFSKHETKSSGGLSVRYKCYRVLSNPLDELDSWEENEGYDPEKSMWGRYVCTANRYLGCMIKQGIIPPWLRGAQVMFETSHFYQTCGKYADAAVGNVPRLASDKALPDFYVSQEDLILQECMSEQLVPIKAVTRIYIDKDARPEVREKALAFAKKHEIPAVEGLPCPDAESEAVASEVAKGEKEWNAAERIGLGVSSSPNSWGVTDEKLRELGKYLQERRKRCWRYPEKPPSDPVAAALAEALDEEFQESRPLGASDAVIVRNRRLREKPPWSWDPPETACDEP